MLLWQHKNRFKAQYCLQLVGCVLLLHLIVFIYVLLQSNMGYDELSVIASTSYDLGADVIVVPFKKVVEQPAIVERQVVSVKQETTVAEVSKIKPIKKAPKRVTPKPEAKPEVKKVEPPIKESNTTEKAKPAKTTSDDQKMLENPQKIKKIEKTQKREVEAPPVKKEPIKRAGPKPVVSTAQKKQIGTKQLRALNTQQAIAQQVNLHWQPPEGFAHDLKAIVAITLDYKGDVDALDMKESSGVLAYDIHARSAIYAMEFPRACWGKKITITFC